jgi:cytochrome c oxidase subunit 1
MMIRAELLTPEPGIWDNVTYNELFTTHGITMLFFFATPAFTGIGNYFLPLLLGADDMAFPRVNAIAFWLLPPGLLLVRGGLIVEVTGRLFALLGVAHPVFEVIKPPATSWTLYVPLAAELPNPQISIMLLGLHLSGLATVMASINFIVTIYTERAEGVNWATLDIFSWALLTTSAIVIFAFPLLGSALVMLLLDRVVGTAFFAFQDGPILWQHLFWFFGHPEVYILVLPAFGLTSYILPKFVGRRLFGFRFVVYSTLAIGVLSFGVWAHHMFATGMDPRLRGSFMAVSLAIAVPSAVKVFNWITTMYNGRIRLVAPLWFSVAGIALLVVGGVTGVFLAAVPIDMVYHGTYYVVGHFHLIILGIIPVSLFAASYYWFPLLTGRRYSERLATIHAVMVTVGVALAFGAMTVIGILGLPRRSATYPAQFTLLQQTASVGAALIFAGVNVWIYNLVQSYRRGERIESADPWDLKATGQFSREWQWFAEHRREE